jgi:HSP20 family molecular chaperone IbpA
MIIKLSTTNNTNTSTTVPSNCCSPSTASVWDPWGWWPTTYPTYYPQTRYYYTKLVDSKSSNKLHRSPVFKAYEQNGQYIVELDKVDWDKRHLTIEYDKGEGSTRGVLRVKGRCKTAYNNGGIVQTIEATFSLPANLDYGVEPQSKLADNIIIIIFAIKNKEKAITRTIPIT